MSTFHIYTEHKSPRLEYVLEWIFKQQLGVGYHIWHNKTEWNKLSGAKVCYASMCHSEMDCIHIKPEKLLFEQDIRKQEIAIHRWKHSTIIFYNQPGAKVPFDLFAAIFFLLSRYEEYDNDQPKDKHGRFRAKFSIAKQFAFLQEPVIDIWIFHFRRLAEQTFNIRLALPKFNFQPTYDIDMAWAYLYKSPLKQLGGLAKDMFKLRFQTVAQRISVLADKHPDPFFTFSLIEKINARYNLTPIYFVLSNPNPKGLDTNTPPLHIAMTDVIKSIAKKYHIGLHPSYHSHQSEKTLLAEKILLTQISEKEITHSRQHFIKFKLPTTFRHLIKCGIQHDYSIGYATENGFRASTANSFFWYDLENEVTTSLVLHPFAFMDATSFFHQKHSSEEAYMEYERLIMQVKKYGGNFIGIWHNYLLGNFPAYKGWYKIYQKMIALSTNNF